MELGKKVTRGQEPRQTFAFVYLMGTVVAGFLGLAADCAASRGTGVRVGTFSAAFLVTTGATELYPKYDNSQPEPFLAGMDTFSTKLVGALSTNSSNVCDPGDYIL